MKNRQSRETEPQTTQNHYTENSNVMYTKSKYIKQTLNKNAQNALLPQITRMKQGTYKKNRATQVICMFYFCSVFSLKGGGGILEFVLAPKGFYIIWLSKYFDLRYMTQNKDEQNQKTQQRKLETKLAARNQPETGMKRN
jgi:hypothetical protein